MVPVYGSSHAVRIGYKNTKLDNRLVVFTIGLMVQLGKSSITALKTIERLRTYYDRCTIAEDGSL